MSICTALVVSGLSSLVSMEQNQAQLFIDVYYSQDNVSKPCNTNFQLSSLFDIFSTKDINSAKKRILNGGRTNIPFTASATNTLMITIASSKSRTIEHFFTDYDNIYNAIGIRVSSSLFYSINQTSFLLR